MSLSEAEILQILKMLEESSFGELRLETGELKLVVRRRGYKGYPADANPVSANPAPAEVQVLQPAIQEAPAHGNAGKPKKMAAQRDGTVAISSPMLGTVYLRPSPDALPYVEVGSFVKEGDTVCLLEVMKVFTAVKATLNGPIIEILVDSNEMVEYGQPLFLVRPVVEGSGQHSALRGQGSALIIKS